jgi:hypothetical protein
MALKWFGSDIYAMKTIRLLSLTGIALVGFVQLTSAGPHTGGFGGGHFGGGGDFGGSHFSGGGIRAAPGFSGGARFGSGYRAAPAFHGGGFRAAPDFRSSGAYFTGRNNSGLNGAPRSYYRRGGVPSVRSPGFTASGNRSLTSNTRRAPAISGRPNPGGSLTTQNTRGSNSQVAAANRQPNRAGSIAGRNQPSGARTSTAANRQSFLRNHAFARHDSNWHHDWDKRHAHFDHNRVFVFVNGFWWGLYPSDYYPYASGDYPYDYNGSYPDDYSGYPYDYYGGYYPYDDYQDNNDNDSTNTASDQYGNNVTISAVQSGLAKLRYYRGAIDGVEGDETQAALARYQQDRDLSVTGTLSPDTLQSLGLGPTGN